MSRAARRLITRAALALALLGAAELARALRGAPEAGAAAQDVPIAGNPYARKKAPSTAKVDAALQHALEDKLAACYEREQGEAPSAEDRKLLREFGAQLVGELADGFSSTSCRAEQPPSASCREQLAALPCETLAEPIVAAGWDRNLTPAQRAQVVEYAAALAGREAACAGREADEARIVNGIRADQLTVLIEAQIVAGRCELHPEKQADCAALLASASCGELVARDSRGELMEACPELLRCREAERAPQ